MTHPLSGLWLSVFPGRANIFSRRGSTRPPDILTAKPLSVDESGAGTRLNHPLSNTPVTDLTDMATARHTRQLRHPHRPGTLLQRHPNHPRRRTRHLPAHSLRHSRLEKELRPTPANREPQQPRQKRRRPRRRLVPGTRRSRLQLRTPRSANRSQPTPTQQLRPRQRRRTRRRTATHPHHQPPPVRYTQRHQRAENPRPTPITHPGTQHRQQPSPLSASTRPENQNPTPNNHQTAIG